MRDIERYRRYMGEKKLHIDYIINRKFVELIRAVEFWAGDDDISPKRAQFYNALAKKLHKIHRDFLEREYY